MKFGGHGCNTRQRNNMSIMGIPGEKDTNGGRRTEKK